MNQNNSYDPIELLNWIKNYQQSIKPPKSSQIRKTYLTNVRVPKNKERNKEIIKYFDYGLSRSEIMKRLNISYTIVAKILTKRPKPLKGIIK